VSTGKEFRAAVERMDLAKLSALLAEEVVFHSPVTFHPFQGRETVTRLLALVAETFEDFHYLRELSGDQTHALVFKARVGEKELEGLDLLTFDEQGLISDFTVMIRPLSGLVHFAELMGQKAVAAGLSPTRT
jgi:hypothetical protein